MFSFHNTVICPMVASDIKSRFSDEIDTSTDLNGIKLRFPLISSPMDTIDSPVFFNKIYELGGIGIIHRFMTLEKQLELYLKCPKETIVSIASNILLEQTRFEILYNHGARNFLIDVANGFSLNILPMLELLQKNDCWVMTGSVADSFGYKWLQLYRTNAIRLGVATGSPCLTRFKTGISYPLLEGIRESKIYKKTSAIIADGGLKGPDDLAKCLFLGADAAMMGNVFAHTVESQEGYLLGDKKKYRGMASHAAMKNIGKIPRGIEGIEFEITVDRTLEQVFEEFNDGLRSCMSYLNAHKIEEMKNGGRIVKIDSLNREGFNGK